MTHAVIFDMDGVLVDSYRAHLESWQVMAARRNLEFTKEHFAKTFGRTSRETVEIAWGKSRFSDEEFILMDDEKEVEYRRIIEERFPEMPGVSNLVRSLAASGFRVAVGSSGPRENVAKAIQLLDCGHLFETAVHVGDVENGKPAPDIFLKAAERLGVQPSACLVVEDSRPGIAAAKAAGMKCIGLASTGHTVEELAEADHVVEHHDEISPELITRLLQGDHMEQAG